MNNSPDSIRDYITKPNQTKQPKAQQDLVYILWPIWYLNHPKSQNANGKLISIRL